MTETPGWAVIEHGDVKIRTVSDTRRAALVNWLVTERGLMIYNHFTDDRIEHLWSEVRNGAEVAPVNITLAHGD